MEINALGEATWDQHACFFSGSPLVPGNGSWNFLFPKCREINNKRRNCFHIKASEQYPVGSLKAIHLLPLSLFRGLIFIVQVAAQCSAGLSK